MQPIDWDLYGIDWSGPVSISDEANTNEVIVPQFSINLSSEALDEAMEGIENLNLIEKYLVTQHVLHSLLQ